jgi:hypothetical protein
VHDTAFFWVFYSINYFTNLVALDKIYTIQHNGKDVLVIDYSHLKEYVMISLLDSAIKLVMERNMPTLVLSILRENYLTPKFIRHLEKELPQVEHLIQRNAITGLTSTQQWILKAVNLWSRKQIWHFVTVDEALEYLVQV